MESIFHPYIGDKELGCLKFMCQDAAGNIYVADCYNEQVQAYLALYDCSHRKELKCKGHVYGVAVYRFSR